MNPSSYSCSTFFLFLFIINVSISSAFSSKSYTPVSYKDHCSSLIPESTPTLHTYNNLSLTHFRTSFITGGERIFGKKSSRKPYYYVGEPYYYVGKSLRFRVIPNSYETITKGIYKIEAFLYFPSPYRYFHSSGNFSYGGSYYRRNDPSIRFHLDGFWSEISKKLCMVGSANWVSEEGNNNALNLDSVLKLNFATDQNPTMYTSFVSGTLESVNSVNDLGYFEPISIFSFPQVSNYNYSLVTKELGEGFFSTGAVDGVSKNESLVLEPSSFCSVVKGRSDIFELEFEKECDKKTLQNCNSLLGGGKDGFLTRFVSLSPIQCSSDDMKIRYLVTFQNTSFVDFSHNFVINSTFIAEGLWDGKNNRVFIVACPILNSAFNCTLRLSLRYPSVWTIRNEGKVVGQIWTNITLFKLTSTYGNDVLALPGLRYTYTKLDRVRQLCPLKKLEKSKKGNVYPDGNSNDMRFDLSVQNSNAWGYALPIFVGNEFYERNQLLVAMSPESGAQFATFSEREKSRSPNFNISYKIRIFTPFTTLNNSSNNLHDKVELNAEGVYNGETGHLCMVGCRKSNNSLDCEILVNFQFVPLNGKGGDLIKGTIRSMREKTDPLYFKDLSVSSTAFSQTAARKSIWRMDFEITMVLISNTLLCIFVGIQILHVKRNPDILSGISIFMLVILSIGLVTPLVLNFEALFLDSHNEQRLWLNNGGWLEANEITIRLVTMVAFLLQIRLLQLVWTAKTSSWVGEKKAFFVTLPMYILGGLLTLLLNRTRNKNSLWNDLRSYSGLILDGFLFPQILLNIFLGSSEKALSHSFYVGSSLVRVVPHAYDQYRAHSYPRSYVNGTYYYANHTADFYSTAWDVVIPFGVIALAVIIFLQQRRGGRCIIPKRFRQELELYQKVPVVNNGQ